MAQREWQETPNGREDDRRIERQEGRLVAVSRPHGALSAGERLRRRIARSREGIHFARLEARDLGHDVRGRAEAVDSEAAGVTCRAQRAVPDEPGA